MAYEIEVIRSAAREIRRLDSRVRRRVLAKIESLKADPRPADCPKLTGSEDLWRVRVGDYRVVYTIQDERLVVVIIRARHRRDVYR